MKLSPVIIAIPIYFLLILIELIVQYVSHRKIYRLNDALSNIGCGIVQQLSGLGLKVLSITAYVVIFENLRLFTLHSAWYTYIILFVAADFLYYWAHRISHEVNLFWGGHVVHHQSEDYNFSVALRQSSFQVVWTFAFYLPLAFLGFDPTDFVFVSALVTVYQFWIHTETIGKLGWFEIIFNTPSHHRVHHGRDPKYIDRNHAGVFIIWDKMFGTFQAEEERPTYGITKPLNSFNPIWANFEHYSWMWHHLKAIKGFGNKVKFIFGPPGWFPEDMGGYQAAPPVQKETYQKYNTTVSKRLAVYLVVQFIAILILTSLFLFQTAGFGATDKWLMVGFIFLSVSNVSSLSENRNFAYYAEFFRWMVIPGLFLSVNAGLLQVTPILSGNIITIWAVLSMIAFIFVHWSKK